jgi:type VI secretion system protein ImpJ
MAMHKLDPVVWAKGTFLNPQHLQLQDRFHESSLHFRTEALLFRPWGFRELRIDQGALASGSIVLTQASGIMPDGLLFDVPRADQAPPVRPLAEHFGPDDESVDVFLAVPGYREGGVNVAAPGRDMLTRYRAEVEQVRDENTGQAEKPVVVAKKSLRLLIGEENREGFSALRIATVQRTRAGLFQLQPGFVPPLVDFRASDYLGTIARRLVEVLSARSDALAGLRRQRNQSLADFTAADVPRFWLLYTVNSFLPVFRHLFETRGGHPEPLFSYMLALAGALTTFSDKVQPRDLPLYDHDNLGPCFTNLDEKVRLLLETVVPSNFVSLPLRLVQPSKYATSIDRDDYFVNTRMYLAMKAEMPKADLIGKAPQLVKAGSADRIDHLVQRALAGVPLSHVPEPPSAFPVKLDYEYFSLSQHGSEWDSVVKARNLAAYVPGDFSNPQLELLILLPQAV